MARAGAYQENAIIEAVEVGVEVVISVIHTRRVCGLGHVCVHQCCNESVEALRVEASTHPFGGLRGRKRGARRLPSQAEIPGKMIGKQRFETMRGWLEEPSQFRIVM